VRNSCQVIPKSTEKRSKCQHGVEIPYPAEATVSECIAVTAVDDGSERRRAGRNSALRDQSAGPVWALQISPVVAPGQHKRIVFDYSYAFVVRFDHSIIYVMSSRSVQTDTALCGERQGMHSFYFVFDLRAYSEREAFLQAATKVVPGFTDFLTEPIDSESVQSCKHNLLFDPLEVAHGIILAPASIVAILPLEWDGSEPTVRLFLSGSPSKSLDESEQWAGIAYVALEQLWPDGPEDCFSFHPCDHAATTDSGAGGSADSLLLTPGCLELRGSIATRFRRFLDVQSALTGWAEKYNIVSDWSLRAAFNALTIPIDSGPPQERFCMSLARMKERCIQYHASSLLTRPRNGERELGSPAPWNPYLESEAQYKRRWEACIHESLARARQIRDESILETKAQFVGTGEKPLARKRKRGNVLPGLRYEWAALKQCSGKTVTEIADRYQEDTEVVRRAANRIIKAVGFPVSGFSGSEFGLLPPS
jgi:hypothetical protein